MAFTITHPITEETVAEANQQSCCLCSVILIMIRGTSHEQDSRFADKSKKMLEKSVWPDEYDQRVNLKKVDFELIKLWIEQKVR
jgi:hypothetical protein